MKKVALGIIAVIILLIASCSKNSSNSSAGSWSFKSNTYNAATCFSPAPSVIEADNALLANTTTYATLRCYFPNNANPTTSGTYKVINYYNGFFTQNNQISILGTINGTPGTSYASTGGNGQETVRVTIASNGFVTVSGSGIVLSNNSDSSSLSLNISQQQ